MEDGYVKIHLERTGMDQPARIEMEGKGTDILTGLNLIILELSRKVNHEPEEVLDILKDGIRNFRIMTEGGTEDA